MSKIEKAIKSNLCLGCGLCAAVNRDNCRMHLIKEGVYRPDFTKKLTIKDDQKISRVCPAIRIHNANPDKNSIWGSVCRVFNAWSAEPNIRQTSSSGGVTSALAIYLLESNKVSAVLHVGVGKENFLYNKLHISRTREDVLSRNASRYAPAAVFDEIMDIFEKNPNDTYAFIGKPCDMAGMQNLLCEYPQYANRIKYYLAIFCAGMPNYNATMHAISTFEKNAAPTSLRYRGDGWPGYFTVSFEDGTSSRMSYNDSWGKILGKQISFRCKICPDGIGLLADISSGDSWNTSNGYPDFTEADGKNFCFIRSQRGLQLFDDATQAGYIQTEILDLNKVKYIQPYQYNKRHYVGWRIVAVQLLTNGMLKFKGIGFYRAALKANYYRAFREMIGTFKRFRKLNRK